MFNRSKKKFPEVSKNIPANSDIENLLKDWCDLLDGQLGETDTLLESQIQGNSGTPRDNSNSARDSSIPITIEGSTTRESIPPRSVSNNAIRKENLSQINSPRIDLPVLVPVAINPQTNKNPVPVPINPQTNKNPVPINPQTNKNNNSNNNSNNKGNSNSGSNTRKLDDKNFRSGSSRKDY